MRTRFYLSRASGGSVWLHVDEADPPAGRSARGYMVSITSRAQALEYLPHLRETLRQAVERVDAPVKTFDVVEEQPCSSQP